MMKIAISVLVAVFFILSGSIESIAFRCGHGYVSVGDSKTKVLLECGKPTSKEKGRVQRGRHYRIEERETDKGDKTKGSYLKEKSNRWKSGSIIAGITILSTFLHSKGASSREKRQKATARASRIAKAGRPQYRDDGGDTYGCNGSDSFQKKYS